MERQEIKNAIIDTLFKIEFANIKDLFQMVNESRKEIITYEEYKEALIDLLENCESIVISSE